MLATSRYAWTAALTCMLAAVSAACPVATVASTCSMYEPLGSVVEFNTKVRIVNLTKSDLKVDKQETSMFVFQKYTDAFGFRGEFSRLHRPGNIWRGWSRTVSAHTGGSSGFGINIRLNSQGGAGKWVNIHSHIRMVEIGFIRAETQGGLGVTISKFQSYDDPSCIQTTKRLKATVTVTEQKHPTSPPQAMVVERDGSEMRAS